MVRAIVDYVAALAETLKIAPPIISRVVIQMRCRQYDAGLSHLRRVLEIGPPRRPAASMTNPSGPLEAHSPADLRPIAGIDLPHLSLDRH